MRDQTIGLISVTEIRRAMIERIGWGRFCEMADAQVIDTDTEVYRCPEVPGDARLGEWWSDGYLKLPRRLLRIKTDARRCRPCWHRPSS